MLIIELLIFIFISFNVIYIALFSLAAKINHKKFSLTIEKPTIKFCLLIPAYKEDSIIVQTVEKMLSLDYPEDLYTIYVVADSLNKETLSFLHAKPIKVIEVAFLKSTKAKAINEALFHIEDPFDYIIIADADNFFESAFLLKLNSAFLHGHSAIQAQRIAKNLNSSFAILDAASEIINNQIFRKGANQLGLSSALIGSGMAFEFNLLKELMKPIEAMGGFDKILQLAVVERGIDIHYLENALVFDEKIDNRKAFGQQRSRWISAQIVYLRKFFLPAITKLIKGNINYFNLAILNNLIIPRIFLIAILPFSTCLSFMVYPKTFIPPLGWLILSLVYSLSLLICLPSSFYNKKLLFSMLQIPSAIITMMMALFNSKKASKHFIHTVHKTKEIDNPLYHPNEP